MAKKCAAHSGSFVRPTQSDLNQPAGLAIQHCPTDSVHPDPLNPRQHDDKQVRQIANSIRVFGFNVPVLVDQHWNVIAGHGRLLAAKLLGMTEVPTIRLDHLSPQQVRAFMIADNKLSENSRWDDALLAEQLKNLSEAELDKLIGGRDHRLFLNTRNVIYRERGMKQNPPSRSEALRLMSRNPNLIKRPMFVEGAEIGWSAP